MPDTGPIELFLREFERAQASEDFDATRCALATADAQGRPSVRFVLCKQVDARGFVFYTNLNSRKGRDIASNSRAALAFHWSSTGVQVRVEGSVSRVSDDEADKYFASRDRESQIGAWASQQSLPLASREELERAVTQAHVRFEGKTIARPPHWSGYRIAPDRIEFWYNQQARLHHRVLFELTGNTYTRTLLQP